MRVRIPKQLRDALWPHQRHAIEAMSRYFANFDPGAPRAALVHMPTGSGKTAVIASLARYTKRTGPVLVVTPRVGLRRQLARDIQGRFFEHANVDVSALPGHVEELDDGAAAPNSLNDAILVSTVQLLTSIRARASPLFEQLQRAALLLFDEGHYEPAFVWSEVVRSVSCPRVIFSATPFRDDLKLFDVDPAHAFRFSFASASKGRYVREVTFHERRPLNSPAEFAHEVIVQYRKLFNGVARGASAPRAIIRCDSPAEIRQIAGALRKQGESVLAIHETFDHRPVLGEFQAVPNPDTQTETYWVHQFKLLEGIDDPRFQMLAMYRELRSVRSLVQQVGRVIRNPKRVPGATAHVLDHSQGARQTRLWKSYLAYDRLIDQGNAAALELNASTLVVAIQNAIPGIVYQDGRLRTPAELRRLDLEDIRLPLSSNVHNLPAAFSLTEAQARMINRCSEDDLFYHAPPVRARTAAVFYVRVGASAFLEQDYFAEPRFGVSVIHARKNYLFTFDSSAPLASLAAEAVPVSAARLRKLYIQSDSTRLTTVSIVNANISVDQVRGRSIRAARVDRLIPSFDEHGYVLRTATGYSRGKRGRREDKERNVRRYVGIDNGRVSDLGNPLVSFEDWAGWTSELVEALDGSRQSLPVFGRWATDANVPANPRARNVLLDLDDVLDDFRTTGEDEMLAMAPIELDDVCADVKDGKFVVRANGRDCTVEIDFDATRARYFLKSPELDRRYSATDEQLRSGVVRYLNRTQSFRVIPETRGRFYTLGQFYRPLIDFGPEFDDAKMGVLNSLVPIKELGRGMREKGEHCLADGRGWEKDCLFDIIDRLGKGTELEALLQNTEVLVCDDLDDENADFLLVLGPTATQRRRVVAVHAKASVQKSVCSATALHDVCGQAQKNLGDVSLFSDPPRNKDQKWGKPWKSGAHTTGSVHDRVRRCPKGTDPAERIWRAVKDPTADREVWIVLGNLLDKAKFKQFLNTSSPPPYAIQAAYLLHATLSSVAAAGARLTVFCS